VSSADFLKGEGDRFLVRAIRQGDGNAFRQLVDRFSGRLRAYAARRLEGSGVDAEDAVQETFLGLVQGLDRLERVRSLQAYLFQILRNKIVDLTAKRPEAHGLRRVPLASEEPDGEIRGYEPVAAEKTPSSYARREERIEIRDLILADVLEEVLNRLKEERSFRDLKVLELLFNASITNREISRLVGTSEPTVTRVKQWALETLAILARQHPRGREAGDLLDTGDDVSDLIRRTWRENLLSCLKRSTLGARALGTLEGEWRDYVDFHLEVVGCDACLANLEDLRSDDPTATAELRERIFTSSVGFLKQRRGE
jgi:RNA polymerase sigma-70 factor (ECF subfamily)